MEEITISEVIALHRRLIESSPFPEDEGQGGQLISEGNLVFVIEESNYFYDPFQKASWILYGICVGHPFVQGNKRIAFLISTLILLRTPERYELTADSVEINSFVRKIAEGGKNRDEIEVWFRQYVKK